MFERWLVSPAVAVAARNGDIALVLEWCPRATALDLVNDRLHVVGDGHRPIERAVLQFRRFNQHDDFSCKKMNMGEMSGD